MKVKWADNPKEYQREWRKNNRERHLEQCRAANKKKRTSRPWEIHYYAAKDRCENQKSYGFRFYGGKGIKLVMSVQDFKTLWFRDKAFEMESPSIDRINSKGNYEISNCRFLELKENCSRQIKTHCLHGHEFSKENTVILQNGWRACRACQLEYQKIMRHKRAVITALLKQLRRAMKEGGENG